MLRESKFNFLKWGEYMKRAQIAERKVEKLKRLLLLTDPVVSDVAVNGLQLIQWSEFIKAFPNDFKQLMFNGASLKDCDSELKALYAIHGKVKKRVKKEK